MDYSNSLCSLKCT